MTIFQKRENEQFTPPASLSSAPAVVNSFVTIVCNRIWVKSKRYDYDYYGYAASYA